MSGLYPHWKDSVSEYCVLKMRRLTSPIHFCSTIATQSMKFSAKLYTYRIQICNYLIQNHLSRGKKTLANSLLLQAWLFDCQVKLVTFMYSSDRVSICMYVAIVTESSHLCAVYVPYDTMLRYMPAMQLTWKVLKAVKLKHVGPVTIFIKIKRSIIIMYQAKKYQGLSVLQYFLLQYNTIEHEYQYNVILLQYIIFIAPF